MTRSGFPNHYLLPDGVHFACQIPWPAESTQDHHEITCPYCKAAIVEMLLQPPACSECGEPMVVTTGKEELAGLPVQWMHCERCARHEA